MTKPNAVRARLRTGERARALLLGGTAICGLIGPWADRALAAGALPTQGAIDLAVATNGAQLAVKTLQAGQVVIGSATYVSTGTSAAVNLAAPRTLVDWTTFHVGSGNSLTFNFAGAGDLVINRVTTGAINVDAGGTVHGNFGGVTAGNIWFLAPNGVFINGTVTASGVLSSNNLGLGDLNLLSDNIASLKSQLSAAGTLIDLTGVETTATDVTIDAAGNIVLAGDVDTGVGGQVNLLSKQEIIQTGGVITANILSGASVGGAGLTDANLFTTLGDFTNTGIGGVSITDAQTSGMSILGIVNAGPGNLLTLTASQGPLTVDAPLGL